MTKAPPIVVTRFVRRRSSRPPRSRNWPIVRSRSAGGEGGGGAEGGVTGFLLGEQSRLTHLMASQVHALHARPGGALGARGARARLRRFSRRGTRTRQGADRLLHDGQRELAQARHGDGAARGPPAGGGRRRARRRRGADRQRDRLADERRRRLAGYRKLRGRRRARPVAVLAQGTGADRGAPPARRAPSRRWPRRRLSPGSPGAQPPRTLSAAAYRAARAGRRREAGSVLRARRRGDCGSAVLARRGGNGDRRRIAALLGRDPRSRLRPRSGRVRRPGSPRPSLWRSASP